MTPAEQPPAPESPGDPLLALALAAKVARLAPADEDRAAELLKERLTGGRAGINAALEPMMAGLPWIVCVNAVSAVWEKLSAPMRRLILAGVAKNETDTARRLQLSLARAVFKIEPAAGLKFTAAAAASLKDPETGALSSKHRQFFFNVLIGKGKPWLLLLPLKDLKGADADALVHGAIECFQICPPYSQLSILRWAAEAGRLGKKTNPADLETAAKAVSRWNAKLQRQLKAEIAELPPALADVLKPEALSEPKPRPEADPEAARQPNPRREERKAAAPEAEAPEAPSEPEAPEAAAPEELIIPGRAERLAQREAAQKAQKETRHPEPQPKEPRPERGVKPAHAFDFKESLRGLETYVASLRGELEAAKAQLHRREEKKPERRRTPEEQSPVEAEALTRHNARLEATIADLQQQLEDLRGHHEAVAESCLLRTGEPLEEGSPDQLRALLALQLAEPYETYLAMRQEALDKVFRLDYRDLLGKVFDTLAEAGVALKSQAQP